MTTYILIPDHLIRSVAVSVEFKCKLYVLRSLCPAEIPPPHTHTDTYTHIHIYLLNI